MSQTKPDHTHDLIMTDKVKSASYSLSLHAQKNLMR